MTAGSQTRTLASRFLSSVIVKLPISGLLYDELTALSLRAMVSGVKKLALRFIEVRG